MPFKCLGNDHLTVPQKLFEVFLFIYVRHMRGGRLEIVDENKSLDFDLQ